MKNVVIASPYATVSPHFETELEIAQRHLDCGDRVTIVSCVGELANCDFNDSHCADRCRECIWRRRHGFAQLRGRVHTCSFDRFLPKPFVAPQFPNSQTVEQLKQARNHQFDVGYAVLSSLVSNCRDPQPDLAVHSELLGRFAEASGQVYQAMLNLIERFRPDLVYVFNGRFAAMRAVLRACQTKDVTCQIHERGCDTKHFQLFENRLPHDIDYMQRRMVSAWNAADPDTREETAAAWFEGRVNRAEKNWHSFVKQQRRGLLPTLWNAHQKNVVLFNSSEDEFVAIGDCWANPLYDDQLSAIHQIANDLARTAPEAHLTVRMHPNLRNVNNQATTKLSQLQLPNVTIVQPAEEIDSYQLLWSADLVVTFGSSMGIEAVFWDKPSVLLGPSFYRNLGGTYVPNSHQQAIDMISRDLTPQSKTGALMYGYWLQSNGIAYQYFEPTGLFSGTFRGQVIYAKPPRTARYRLSRKWQSVKKRINRLTGRATGEPASRDAA